MTKTFCDRCGMERRVDSIRLPRTNGTGGWVYAPVELCPDCCLDIARFLDQKTEKGGA